MFIALFGKFSLTIALCLQFLQALIPPIGFIRKNPYLLGTSRIFAWSQFIFIFLAYIFLTIAFATNDFSIAYVAQNSHPTLPLIYRLTALWGGHEGSVLLWIMFLSVWTIIVAQTLKNNDLLPLIIAILGIINFCFLSFLLFTSNPFLLATHSLSGNDLNPLLQDPGFVIHPPMLYMGYVGFSVAFAITQAFLIAGKLDANWAIITRRFTLMAWCFLTLGITLGSWWAYRVLGWGGFWFWDPVENASLLPWLSGTALIHILNLVIKRNIAIRFCALLTIITFALSLLGTFLVRSGILISAHTFANDPARGVFLLLLLAILLIAALTVYSTRISQVKLETDQSFSLLSRETGLLTNSALLLVAMLTILLGTLYPLILDALHLGTISVGAPYFNSIMMPLVLLTMLVMGFFALCKWQKQDAKLFWLEVMKKMLISIFISLLFIFIFNEHFEFISTTCVILSIWIILCISQSARTSPCMSLAHAGFAILVLGIILSSFLNQERDVRIKPGDLATVGPYEFLFRNVAGISGSNYRGIRAEFNITKNDRPITQLYPEKRIYLVRDMVMTKVAIHPGLFRDLYIALGEPLDNEYWSVRLYYKPFIRLIWLGGFIMMLGGLLGSVQRTLFKNAR